MSPRARWHLFANAPVAAWLIGCVAVALAHRQVPQAGWLLVHTVLLGAVSTAIMVWSSHFTAALLRLPDGGRSRAAVGRLAALQAGALIVVGGMVADRPFVVAIGAAVVAAAVLLHAVALIRMLRRALPARFAVSVRYYVVAALLLPVGAALGALLARSPDDATAARLVLGHVVVLVLGWVGLTVVGTLITLWPTMLRTRLASGSEAAARRALPLLAGGVIGATAALLVVPQRWAGPAAALGLALVLAGLALAGRPLARAMLARPPRTFATWSTLAASCWLLSGVVLLAIALAAAGSPAQALDRLGPPTAALAAGFAAQVLLAALSYLVPVVRGGGPHAVRRTEARLERGGAARAVLANGGLLLCLLPVPSPVVVVGSLLVLAALIWFLVLLVLSALPARSPATGAVIAPAGAVAAPGMAKGGTGLRGATAGLFALVLAVALGVGVEPGSVAATAMLTDQAQELPGPGRHGPEAAGGSAVQATGSTTRVEVTMRRMRFEPAVIEVPLGDRLVIDVRNADGDRHDLVLESGPRTKKLAPGKRATLDAGVIGGEVSGWCSIFGHRQMGMTLAIKPVAAAGGSAHEGSGHESSGHGSGGVHGADAPERDAGPVHDAALAAAAPSRLHRVTLRVREVTVSVGRGRTQRRWTFNGTAPGPTLRGRVGDRFEVTLINEASMGHSIDFHASALAPDGPMRTIQPGELLTYRFTARRAGAWLYHCGTMPMSVHVANGMFGAVIIDPPDLAPVDREYLLVQSEVYPGADTVDPAKVAAERPDLVVFNGAADQYLRAPLSVSAGDRVRLWVLDAGPSRSTSFHVVGGQFDTVYAEGNYLLRRSAGGAQGLALAPGQGGFVELELPEPGSYPFLSHLLVDAERGAMGAIRVTARATPHASRMAR